MTDKKRITLRLPDEVYEALIEKSYEYDIGINQLVIVALLQHFKIL